MTENENQKNRPPLIPPDLANRPRPRALEAAEKYGNDQAERHAQANVTAVEIILVHREALAGLKKIANEGRLQDVKDLLDDFIATADRTLIAARGE